MTERSNEAWLEDLRAGGDRQAHALEDLRALVLRALPYALSGKLDPSGAEFAALAEETAQETLMRVLDNLDSFEGRAAFTTWVYKIAVRAALGELRRRRWRDVPLPEMDMDPETDAAPRELPDETPGPQALVERQDLMQRMQRILREELTDKQRQALMAVSLQEMPLEEAAARLGMNRNALYKLMHDARLRLKRRMEAEGMSPADVLASFTAMQG